MAELCCMELNILRLITIVQTPTPNEITIARQQSFYLWYRPFFFVLFTEDDAKVCCYCHQRIESKTLFVWLFTSNVYFYNQMHNLSTRELFIIIILFDFIFTEVWEDKMNL